MKDSTAASDPTNNFGRAACPVPTLAVPYIEPVGGSAPAKTCGSRTLLQEELTIVWLLLIATVVITYFIQVTAWAHQG